jgi:hypothetical protein
MQSVPILNKVVSLNPTHVEVFCIQHYVIKWLEAGQFFSPGTSVSSTNKNDRHDLAEILYKVALCTIHLVCVGVIESCSSFTFLQSEYPFIVQSLCNPWDNRWFSLFVNLSVRLLYNALYNSASCNL